MNKIKIKEIQKKNPYVIKGKLHYQIDNSIIYDFYVSSRKSGFIFLSLKYH